MSSIFSTQNRHTFLRRKNCFFWVATALSPPVGRCAALPGLPLNSGMVYSSFGKPGTAAASVVCCAGGGAPGAGPAGAAAPAEATRLAARLSRSFLRFSSRFSVSSMRTVRNRSEEHTSELQSIKHRILPFLVAFPSGARRARRGHPLGRPLVALLLALLQPL